MASTLSMSRMQMAAGRARRATPCGVHQQHGGAGASASAAGGSRHRAAMMVTMTARQQNNGLCGRGGGGSSRSRCGRQHARLAVTCGASAARKGSRHFKVVESVPKEIMAQYVEPMGDDPVNTTYYPKGDDTAKKNKQWYIVDAEGQTLGRLASMVAKYIRGFNDATYHPSMDMGSIVVIINAEKVDVSGKKAEQKLYRRVNVGRPGSMKVESFRELQKRIPERIVEKAIWGMLPKGRLGRKLFHNMKVYKGPNHPHEAQAPVDITKLINVRTAPEKEFNVKEFLASQQQ